MSSVLDMSSDPLRPRDWRWLYAQFVANNRGTKLSRECKDEDIVSARDYILEYTKITEGPSKPVLDSRVLLYSLRLKWPILSQAEAAWSSSKFMRFAIEALICARVPADVIAAQFGCDVSVIDTYEHYFFDVRGRLDNELWVLNELMSPSAQQGMSCTDWDYFWKSLGYWYGPGVLHQFWRIGKLPDDVRQELANYSEDMRLRNLAKAQTVRSINSFNAHEVIDEAISIQKKSEGDTDDNVDTHLLRGANVVLQNVVFNISNPTASLGHIESRELDGGIIEGEYSDVPLPKVSVLATRKPTEDKVELKEDEIYSAKDLVTAQKSAGIDSDTGENIPNTSLADKRAAIVAAIRAKREAQAQE